ncbi:MAG: hypothetical protein V4792_11280 [Pseudomonadota bacterium]
MTATRTTTDLDPGRYELRFRSLFHEGRAFAFACDGLGRIDLDRLSERARERYLYARALVGREFAWPAVQAVAAD